MAKNNLAYDFERYEKKQAAQAELPTIQKVKTSSGTAAKPVNLFAVFVLLLAVIALTFSMIYTRVMLNEINDEINIVEKQIDKNEGERVRLLNDLESAKSLKNIEEYAKNELGLVKIDNNQIKHFSVTKGNKIELYRQPEKTWLQKIESLFVNFMEYISP